MSFHREVKFAGIDDWNRPVFKATDTNKHYGSTDILFDYGSSQDDVLKIIEASNLLYFGDSFNCEPFGSEPEIVLNIVTN